MTGAPYDAIVLAGGAGTRLGGVDKAGLDVGGNPLLERALSIVAGAQTVVVAGDQRPTSRVVRLVREDPPGAGPAAGICARTHMVTGHTDVRRE